MINIDKHLSDMLLDLRKDKGLTQSELAEMLGCTRVNLHYIETGKQKLNPVYIYLICCIFRIRPNQLFPAIKMTTIAKKKKHTLIHKIIVPTRIKVSGLPKIIKKP